MTILNGAFAADRINSNTEPNPQSSISIKTQEKGGTTTPATTIISHPARNEKMTMDQYLDRLMMAESGGHVFARSKSSTATGPFQFIASTWLAIFRNYFPRQLEQLTVKEVLELRTDLKLARKAAELYTIENAKFLKDRGAEPTFINLRIAFLVGPTAAVRVLSENRKTQVRQLLTPLVLRANPILRNMTVEQLIARSARDLMVAKNQTTGPEIPPGDPNAAARQRKPAIRVRCNLARPSCRRWLHLKRKRLRRGDKQIRRAKRSQAR